MIQHHNNKIYLLAQLSYKQQQNNSEFGYNIPKHYTQSRKRYTQSQKNYV